MSTEENKAVVRRIPESLVKGNVAVIDELFSPAHVHHLTPTETAGLEDNKQMVSRFKMMSAAFPDGQATIEDQIAEGDKVVTRWTFRGTHKGGYMGIAPTNKRVTVTAIAITRIEGGKVAESWGGMDMLSLMQQLGVVPPPGK